MMGTINEGDTKRANNCIFLTVDYYILPKNIVQAVQILL